METLAANLLLRGLSDRQLDQIQAAGSRLNANAGDRLIEEGRVPQSIYFIIDGEVEVLLPDPADRASGKRLATLRGGDCFGEYGFIDRRPTSASVYAAVDSILFGLPISRLDELLKGDTQFELQFYKNLLQVMVNRLRAGNVLIDMLR